jgi:hypothetical protein
MKLIAHRGNTHGPNPSRENSNHYLEIAILAGYDVEIDLWYIGNKFYSGHDFPQYETSLYLSKNAWYHCKNIAAFENLAAQNQLSNTEFKFFWHQTDDYVLTSNGKVWTYPGKTLIKNSIAVMPEKHYDGTQLQICYGICSDYVSNYLLKQ